jgi:hypothetical protein
MECNWKFAEKFIIWKWKQNKNKIWALKMILCYDLTRRKLSATRRLQSNCSEPHLVARDDSSGLERVWKPSQPVYCKQSRTGNRRRWVVSPIIWPSSYVYPKTEMAHVGGEKKKAQSLQFIGCTLAPYVGVPGFISRPGDLLSWLLLRRRTVLDFEFVRKRVWLLTQGSRVRFQALPDFSEQQWVWNGVHSASWTIWGATWMKK